MHQNSLSERIVRQTTNSRKAQHSVEGEEVKGHNSVPMQGTPYHLQCERKDAVSMKNGVGSEGEEIRTVGRNQVSQ